MSKSPDAFRTISEVADWLGVQAHVLRFWESKFQQVKPVKRAGGRRYYRPADMMLLGGIRKLLHDDGLSIKEAQAVLRDRGVPHVCQLSHPLEADLDDLMEAQVAITSPQALASEQPVDEVVEDLPEESVASSLPEDPAPTEEVAEPEPATAVPQTDVGEDQPSVQESAGLPAEPEPAASEEAAPTEEAPAPEVGDMFAGIEEPVQMEGSPAPKPAPEPVEQPESAAASDEGEPESVQMLMDLDAPVSSQSFPEDQPTPIEETATPGNEAEMADVSAELSEAVPEDEAEAVVEAAPTAVAIDNFTTTPPEDLSTVDAATAPQADAPWADDPPPEKLAPDADSAPDQPDTPGLVIDQATIAAPAPIEAAAPPEEAAPTVEIEAVPAAETSTPTAAPNGGSQQAAKAPRILTLLSATTEIPPHLQAEVLACVQDLRSWVSGK